MPTSRTSVPSSIYQIRVTLKGVRPPIWRRLLVAGDTRLARLHDVLQIAMGWTDSHLHQFTAGGIAYGQPDREYGLDVRDERRVALSQVLAREKAKLAYQYDFGDSWEHDVLVEKILAPEPGVRYPICIAGRRACPPEDCGGIWGYAGFIEAIRDPQHPEHDDTLEWIGGDFDPEQLDLDAINQELSRIR
jgi:hypothetical protein